MNTELKNLINTIFDGEKLVVDSIKGNYFAIITDGLALLSDVPGDIAGFGHLMQEIKDLTIPANEADLVAYIQQKFASIAVMSGPRAQAVIKTLVNLITAAIALEQAFVN